MKLTLQLLALFLTTCGVAHDEPVAAVAWDDVSEAGWTLAETGFVELPARHITHALSAGEKLVTVVDATGAAFMAQVRKGGGATPLIPMDERMSAGGRWAHLTLRRAPRPPSSAETGVRGHDPHGVRDHDPHGIHAPRLPSAPPGP